MDSKGPNLTLTPDDVELVHAALGLLDEALGLDPSLRDPDGLPPGIDETAFGLMPLLDGFDELPAYHARVAARLFWVLAAAIEEGTITGPDGLLAAVDRLAEDLDANATAAMAWTW